MPVKFGFSDNACCYKLLDGSYQKVKQRHGSSSISFTLYPKAKIVQKMTTYGTMLYYFPVKNILSVGPKVVTNPVSLRM